MSIAAFEIATTRLSTTLPKSDPFFVNAMAGDAMSDRRMSSVNEGMFVPTTLILRKLPWNTTNEAVRTMLLFAKDLQDTELVPNEYQEDQGFVTAAARFSTVTGASEAQMMLDGKPNTAGQANMIVEIVSNASLGGGRRNTIDPASARSHPQPMSSPPPSQAPKSSRFNDTFQSLEKMSPPPIGSPPEHLTADGKSHLHGLLSSQSPKQPRERPRVPARSVIEDDAADDETGELLKDSLAYLKNDNGAFSPVTRQLPNPRMPITAFNALSLNTNMNQMSSANYTSPRSAAHTHTPNGGFPSNGHGYQGANQYLRHNYPPVNPADQNPPCNTLYVGNLPMDTSEDELKAMFSKQRGYKRLCFRTKQNGPMCFVEFEDISFATKALNELYGAQLHNSVKGGIRLSFSKNPLGVRSGQPGSTNPSTPLSPGAGMMNNMTPLSPGGFSTANGPPPGLSAPPGLAMSGTISPPLQNGQYTHQGFPHAMSPIHGTRGTPMGTTPNGSHSNSMYPDYMMGR